MPTYDSKKVSVILKAKATNEPWVASGFAEGSRVNVAKGEDAAGMVVGSDGEHCFSISHNHSGTIVLTLLQSSSTNDFLSSQHNLQRLLGEGVLEVTVKDNRGRSLHFAPEARIQKIPDANYETGVGSREWTLLAPVIEDFVGGIG